MDIVTLAAARKSGGSGGDVTKQYVDEHLALKADKTETAEYPIASSTTGVNPTITDSADSTVQGLTVYGKSRVSKNLLIPTASLPTTIQGVRWSLNNDGTVSATRISSGADVSDLVWGSCTLPAGSYTVDAFIPNGSGTSYRCGIVYNGNTTWITLKYNLTLTEETEITIKLRIYPEYDANNVIFSPLICTAEAYEADPTFEPYGIISIGDSGSLNVQTCGKNLLDPTLFEVDKYQNFSPDNHTITYNATTWITGKQKVIPNQTYKISFNGEPLNVYGVIYGANERIIYNVSSVSTQDGDETICFNVVKNNIPYGGNIQLELGSTATAYELYISSTAPLTTGLPLCGIPVNSGETYTDGDGVKWLADTASVEGVVKRCYKVTLDGSESWTVNSDSTTGDGDSKRLYCTISTPAPKSYNKSVVMPLVCNKLELSSPDAIYSNTRSNVIAVYNSEGNTRIYVRVYGIATTSDLETYLTSNPITVIYELATPTVTPLTTEEQQSLLALRTFDSTTNITVTDDPFVDISYLKNTANGKAAKQLADNLRASIGWISAVPEMHRNILRGKYLGSSVTAAQLAAIADGSFDDLYIGDYWTINNTVYRIADMDFFRTDANSPFVFTTHHLVIVPDGTMYKAKMNNNSATTSGGYKNSDMRTTNISAAKTTINADFPDMVLTYKDLLVTATSSGTPTASDYFDCDIELMSETMLFGGYVNAKPSNPPYFCASANPTQFALFRLDPQFIITDRSETIWLRDAADGTRFCTMEYSPFGRDANYADGAVRPFFLIGDAT